MISTKVLKSCVYADEMHGTRENKQRQKKQQLVSLDVALERRTMKSISEISAPDRLSCELNFKYQSAPDRIRCKNSQLLTHQTMVTRPPSCLSTAVCVLCLIKLSWPAENKNFYNSDSFIRMIITLFYTIAKA